VLFHNSIIGNFVVYQDRLETNLLQLFLKTNLLQNKFITKTWNKFITNRSFRMVFNNACYYFRGQHCCRI